MGYLLDTNVISELTKPQPNQGLVDWFWDNEGFCTSTISISELYCGIMRLPEGKRKTALKQHTDALVRDLEGSVLPFDVSCSYACAELRHKAHLAGRTPSAEDLMIAAIAKAGNHTVVTRNVRDFEYLGVKVLNPFDYQPRMVELPSDETN